MPNIEAYVRSTAARNCLTRSLSDMGVAVKDCAYFTTVMRSASGAVARSADARSSAALSAPLTARRVCRALVLVPAAKVVFLAARRGEQLGVLAAVGDPIDAFVVLMTPFGNKRLFRITARGHQLRALPIGRPLQFGRPLHLTLAWPRASSAAQSELCAMMCAAAGAIGRARARARAHHEISGDGLELGELKCGQLCVLLDLTHA